MNAPTSPDRYRRRASWPHPGVAVLACLGALIALWPCSLPRSATISGVLTAGCVGLATVAGSWCTRGRPFRPAGAAAGVLAATGAIVCIGVVSTAWQDALRADVGAPRAGIGWWAVSTVPAIGLFCAIVLVPRATAVTFAAGAALLAGYLPAAHADKPAPHRAAPAAPVLYQPDDVDHLIGAHRLVTRWVREGGLARGHVVIAVPTGSGWVDETAVTGFVHRFGGDVTVLALQYAHQSSWRAFVGDRAAAGRSTTALLREVIAVRDRQRPEHRPAIHLYGQSLGAVGADEARAWAARHHPGAVGDTLLAGAPADTLGASMSGDHRTVLANRSDPVARWSIALLWRLARLPADTITTGRSTRRPPWLPLVGFVQTSVDLLTSLDGPPGIGHRYASYPMGPRAAS
ncbi:alpha/beta-hydrolase family protein [Gordonia sp. CPCC 205515]|uniref:alpha/beta-hydrolase family protein n=1 Tax=Gordonia sp. CPCC 205515 TaxID=3140791 RepID=UPI003AF37C8C